MNDNQLADTGCAIGVVLVVVLGVKAYEMGLGPLLCALSCIAGVTFVLWAIVADDGEQVTPGVEREPELVMSAETLGFPVATLTVYNPLREPRIVAGLGGGLAGGMTFEVEGEDGKRIGMYEFPRVAALMENTIIDPLGYARVALRLEDALTGLSFGKYRVTVHWDPAAVATQDRHWRPGVFALGRFEIHARWTRPDDLGDEAMDWLDDLEAAAPVQLGDGFECPCVVLDAQLQPVRVLYEGECEPWMAAVAAGEVPHEPHIWRDDAPDDWPVWGYDGFDVFEALANNGYIDPEGYPKPDDFPTRWATEPPEAESSESSDPA